MTEADAWLDAYTFYCERLHIRMQPKQCKVNQRDDLPSCLNCPQKGNIEAGVKPLKLAAKEKGVSMGAKCKVDGCGKLSQNGKDGMCCAHWRDATGAPIAAYGTVRDAAAPKPKYRQCKAAGCDKYAVVQGMCTRHHNEQIVSTPDAPPLPPPPFLGLPEEQRNALSRLLVPARPAIGMFIPMANDLFARIKQQGITPDDICDLLEMLMNKELCRFAAPAPPPSQKDAQPNSHVGASA